MMLFIFRMMKLWSAKRVNRPKSSYENTRARRREKTERFYNKCVFECMFVVRHGAMYPNRKSIIISYKHTHTHSTSIAYSYLLFRTCFASEKVRSHRSLQSLFMAKYITANIAFSACLSKHNMNYIYAKTVSLYTQHHILHTFYIWAIRWTVIHLLCAGCVYAHEYE